MILWMIIVITIIWILFLMTGCANTKIIVCGIDYNDIKGRKALPALVGCATSFVIHEAGHLVAGHLVGMDTSMKWDRGPVAHADNYFNKSQSQKALFHGGGFLAQALVGTVLTAIPYTRHSDFSLGFTGFTMFNNLGYGITGKSLGREDISDVANLDRCGYDGTAIALAGGILSGVLAYTNLNKHKLDQNDSTVSFDYSTQSELLKKQSGSGYGEMVGP